MRCDVCYGAGWYASGCDGAVVCHACDGTCRKDRVLGNCPDCEGTGREDGILRMVGAFGAPDTKCARCKGTGDV